jgi:uncharacterized damage-inducible protein DinB
LHDALPSLDFVIEEWPRLQTKWEAWADAATDADMARQVPFKSRFVGNAGLPAWQIVMHVVNHATLHRGQIVGMLRQLGAKPPTTDIVFTTTNKLRLPQASAIRHTPGIREH